MSRGMKAGLEIRETQRSALDWRHHAPIGMWCAIVPSIDVDWVENRGCLKVLAGHGLYPDVEPMLPRRGLPEDVTREMKRLHDEWNGLAFDGNWVTLDELRAVAQDVRLYHHASVEATVALLNGFEARDGEASAARAPLHEVVARPLRELGSPVETVRPGPVCSSQGAGSSHYPMGVRSIRTPGRASTHAPYAGSNGRASVRMCGCRLLVACQEYVDRLDRPQSASHYHATSVAGPCATVQRSLDALLGMVAARRRWTGHGALSRHPTVAHRDELPCCSRGHSCAAGGVAGMLPSVRRANPPHSEGSRAWR